MLPAMPNGPHSSMISGMPAPVLLRWGAGNLRLACVHSVSMVGSRAATGYGNHVAIEMAATLAERGVAVISGGAYGIDASSHRGALAAEGETVAVLAGGLQFGYPRGHADLFQTIAGQGVLVSECPPDRGPTRPGFLVRNRIIAALSRGTVVVEAALRSGALNSARHARELCLPVMAVPGPVTSEQSAGCHELIRDYGAMCVTCATDVFEHIGLPGEHAAGRLGSVRARRATCSIPRRLRSWRRCRCAAAAARPASRCGPALTWTPPCAALACWQQPDSSGIRRPAGHQSSPIRPVFVYDPARFRAGSLINSRSRGHDEPRARATAACGPGRLPDPYVPVQPG